MSELTDKFEEIINRRIDPDRPIAQIDQNNAVIKQKALEAGIDLDDPVALEHFWVSVAVVTSLYMWDVVETCDIPDCQKIALAHIEASAVHLGGHIQEMRKLSAARQLTQGWEEDYDGE